MAFADMALARQQAAGPSARGTDSGYDTRQSACVRRTGGLAAATSETVDVQSRIQSPLDRERPQVQRRNELSRGARLSE